jgi:hypothetical protein
MSEFNKLFTNDIRWVGCIVTNQTDLDLVIAFYVDNGFKQMQGSYTCHEPFQVWCSGKHRNIVVCDVDLPTDGETDLLATEEILKWSRPLTNKQKAFKAIRSFS